MKANLSSCFWRDKDMVFLDWINLIPLIIFLLWIRGILEKLISYSEIVFILMVSYVTYISWYYNISVFNQFNEAIQLVLTIWTAFGIYVGFLQFAAGYENKENGTYLGYQKMDFLTSSNFWYNIANSTTFVIALCLSIIIPLLLEKNTNLEILGVNLHFLWQGIISGLLILFMNLLIFSLYIAQVTIEINKKSDKGLENFIEYSIKSEYKKQFKKLERDKFSANSRERYFRKLSNDLSRIETTENKIEFLKIVLNKVSIALLDSAGTFDESDRKAYKCFLNERYIIPFYENEKGVEVATFLLELYESDMSIFDTLIEKNNEWLKFEYEIKEDPMAKISKHIGKKPEFKDKSEITVKCNYREKRVCYNWGDEQNNLHISLFRRILELSNDEEFLNKVAKFLVSKNRNNFTNMYWKVQSNYNLDHFDLSQSSAEMTISKKEVKKITCLIDEAGYIPTSTDGDTLTIRFDNKLLSVEILLKDKKNIMILRNEVKDYYDNFTEEAWSLLFEKYKHSQTKSIKILPKLRDPERDLYSDKIRDVDNKIPYSRICFNYLSQKYDKINSKETENQYLMNVVKSMTKEYQVAFSLNQLLPDEEVVWNKSIEDYYLISDSSLCMKGSNENISSILSISCIDSKLKNFEDGKSKFNHQGANYLGYLLVKDLISDNKFYPKNNELDESLKKEIIFTYLSGLSLTPAIFSLQKDDGINSYMKSLISDSDYIKHIEFIKKLPVVSLLCIEMYYNSQSLLKEGKNSENFMIELIRKEESYNIFSPSILKFLTLKVIKSEEYLTLFNDSKFRKEYGLRLLNHLNSNDLSLNLYLEEIREELNFSGSEKLGDIKIELIKKKLENIIFEL